MALLNLWGEFVTFHLCKQYWDYFEMVVNTSPAREQGWRLLNAIYFNLSQDKYSVRFGIVI